MSAPAGGGHEPVMIAEVLECLRPQDGGIYVDGTFGAGGYSRAILDAADCRVWAIDRDPDAIAAATGMIGDFDGRLTVIEGRFGDMATLIADLGVGPVDGVALDLGVSSMQLDDPARGFSFRHDGPLDMRQARDGESAEEIVNEADEAVLADIIYQLGEERQARRIARAIVEARTAARITRTGQLAEIVRGAYRGRAASRIDPATRTFQAIRMQVNQELAELDRGLNAAEIVLAPGGMLAVVSFHSLEDRAVKSFLRERSGTHPGGSRHAPEITGPGDAPTFRLHRRGARKPTEAEVSGNPRARSARLRAAERTDAAPRRAEG